MTPEELRDLEWKRCIPSVADGALYLCVPWKGGSLRGPSTKRSPLSEFTASTEVKKEEKRKQPYYPPRKDVDTEAIIRYYRRGNSIESTGKHFGCSKMTIRDRLVAAGEPIRRYSRGESK